MLTKHAEELGRNQRRRWESSTELLSFIGFPPFPFSFPFSRFFYAHILDKELFFPLISGVVLHLRFILKFLEYRRYEDFPIITILSRLLTHEIHFTQEIPHP
jgi:hypothetical protein